MAPGKIKVNIFGSEYSLIGDEDESSVRQIAAIVDEKMREIDHSTHITSITKIAILAALNIAEELIQERQYRDRLLEQINEEARKMNYKISELLDE
ncbi:MAG TPA: cell division protein ZapA [Caldithrix abyssi]|uniref:Cell division protein ZapA n=1 Tax=Caldithrix abyssi TaxID=187145 RepID=A0A7V5VEJ8_CALAY|nr:cell division protein ZapA [Caldithrix abyssi]